MQLRFRILNVFTTGGARLSGNPLCVVEDGSGSIPRRCRRSRASSISPRPRSSCRRSAAAALVRIFTPAYEMPFAGHPTLGTAHVCRALGLGGDQLGLEMRAGIIPVTATAITGRCAPRRRPRALVEVRGAGDRRLLGLEPGDIGFQPLWVKAGP
jgi:predicted PhzF superfamily epimerase YddE/YHI9